MHGEPIYTRRVSHCTTQHVSIERTTSGVNAGVASDILEVFGGSTSAIVARRVELDTRTLSNDGKGGGGDEEGLGEHSGCKNLAVKKRRREGGGEPTSVEAEAEVGGLKGSKLRVLQELRGLLYQNSAVFGYAALTCTASEG